MSSLPHSDGLLVLPRLRVQNANAISSPLTHGFPSMTAFLGLMWALERKLEVHDLPLALDSVGVVCHDFDEQTTEGGYVKTFRLTRNPIDKDGGTAAIVEEGRMHMEITLVFGVSGGFVERNGAERNEIATNVATELANMRIAGGSVLPSPPDWRHRPTLESLAQDADEARRQFRYLRRRCLPGFALVCRDDLLQARLAHLRSTSSRANVLDALLDLSRFNWRPEPPPANEPGAEAPTKVRWAHDRTEGWIVPIPVGYGALSDVFPAGSVVSARDADTDFRFVESLFSIGQWIGPHRLQSISQLLWYSDANPAAGRYRCHNDYAESLCFHHRKEFKP